MDNAPELATNTALNVLDAMRVPLCTARTLDLDWERHGEMLLAETALTNVDETTRASMRNRVQKGTSPMLRPDVPFRLGRLLIGGSYVRALRDPPHTYLP